jgi:hypothetical protein
MPVTQHPLHRSVRAELLHTVLALGGGDQMLWGTGGRYVESIASARSSDAFDAMAGDGAGLAGAKGNATATRPGNEMCLAARRCWPSACLCRLGNRNSRALRRRAWITRLNTRARTHPFQRVAHILTNVRAWLGAAEAGYAFIVRLIHSQHIAGFDRRKETSP